MTVTLKELKDKKEFTVTRIDKEFISNEEIIRQAQEETKKYGYTITFGKRNGNYQECVLFNKDKIETLRYYMGSNNTEEEKQKFINDILNKQDRQVLKHYIEDNDLCIEVQGEKLYHSLRLNPPYMKETLKGKIILRSKDYIFEFTDDDNNIHKLYSSSNLKASMLQDNKIVVENYPIEYTL